MASRTRLYISIKHNGEVYDLTDYVDINSVRIQERVDWSFEGGSMNILTDELSMNIPPYTPLEIEERRILDGGIVDSIIKRYYVTSSTANVNLLNNKKNQQLTLLNLNALLECFILGSKTYSNICYSSDNEVLNTTLELINDKYSITIASDSTNSSLLTSNNEYTFQAGTTLFEVCQQIANRNNLKFRVEFNTSDFEDASIGNIKIIFYQHSYSYASLAASTITSKEYLQDTNNYCKYLETEAKNVVDRDLVVHWKDLTCRAMGNRLTADDALLVLPCAVEGIIKFEVNFGTRTKPVTLRGIHPDIDVPLINRYNPTSYGTYILSEAKTMQQWINENIKDEDGNNIIQILYDLGLNKNVNSSALWQLEYDYIEDRGMLLGQAGDGIRIGGLIDYTSQLLEESEWEALSPENQPKYAVYKSGGNTIQNMYANYNNNLWGWISGTAIGNFLGNKSGIDRIGDSNTIYVEIQYTASVADTLDPRDFSYNIDAIPITNPVIFDTKSNSPINETNYKPVGRSYQNGDSNGLPIYFDALKKDINKQKNTLGVIEMTINCNSTDYNRNITTSSYIIDSNANFYVFSIEHRYTLNNRFTQINLSKEQYKIANAIGVDYQFNPTLLPNKNIVDRPIYFSTINSTWRYYALHDNCIYVVFTFRNSDGTSKYLAKRASVIANGSYEVYLYVEALDNYSFDKQKWIDYSSGSESIPTCRDVSYVGSKYDVTTCDIELYLVNSMSKTDSESLPNASAVTGATTHTAIVTNLKIYKDARERLTFTIKL